MKCPGPITIIIIQFTIRGFQAEGAEIGSTHRASDVLVEILDNTMDLISSQNSGGIRSNLKPRCRFRSVKSQSGVRVCSHDPGRAFIAERLLTHRRRNINSSDLVRHEDLMQIICENSHHNFFPIDSSALGRLNCDQIFHVKWQTACASRDGQEADSASF
jgi:hypothetical protein